MEGWNGNDPLQANAGVHKHPALNQLHEFQFMHAVQVVTLRTY